MYFSFRHATVIALYAIFAEAQRWPERVHNPSRFRKPITKFINGTDVEVYSVLCTPSFLFDGGCPCYTLTILKKAFKFDKKTSQCLCHNHHRQLQDV